MSLGRIYSLQTHLRTINRSSSAVLGSMAPCYHRPRPEPMILRPVSSSSLVRDKQATATTAAAKPIQKHHDWNRAVSEAEKIVGYPTSFLSLRWLLNDEMANVALHLRRLIGSNHPLLKTAKALIFNGKNHMQTWGLIVLLISKAVGHAPSVPDMEQDKSAGVLHSQRVLAEVTEMVRTASLVHQGLINLQPLADAGNELSSDDDMIFGNKIALLSGDYLLVTGCSQLAGLNNQELMGLITSAVRDLAEANFVGDRDEQNTALPSKPDPEAARSTDLLSDDDLGFGDLEDNMEPLKVEGALGNPEKEWSLRHILSAGSLLGKSCQGAMILAKQPVKLHKQAYLFGKHLSLAWQACNDIELFSSPNLTPGQRFSLVSAPVLFHLAHDPTLYEEIKKGHESVDNIDYAKIYNEIINGPGVEKTYILQKKHSLAAMAVLSGLPPSDARTALQNIILAMQD